MPIDDVSHPGPPSPAEDAAGDVRRLADMIQALQARAEAAGCSEAAAALGDALGAARAIAEGTGPKETLH